MSKRIIDAAIIVAIGVVLAAWTMGRENRADVATWFTVSPTVEIQPVYFTRIPSAKMPPILSAKTLRELECLADNIYYEAGVEDRLGKIAVARVVMERIDHPEFPSTPCQVVYHGARYSKEQAHLQRGRCQFSWLCQGKRPEVPNPQVWEESWAVAVKVYVHGKHADFLPGALFYHADYVNPRWPYRKIAKVGRHIFYTTNSG